MEVLSLRVVIAMRLVTHRALVLHVVLTSRYLKRGIQVHNEQILEYF